MGQMMNRAMVMVNEVAWTPTTYIQPHEYVLQKSHPSLYTLIHTLIIAEGYDAKFMGRTYRYVDINGYKYWVVGHVLNRERLPDGD